MNPAFVDFLICFFFGMFGVHRFRLRQVGLGFAYFFTIGFFGIAWVIDTVRFLLVALSGQRVVAAQGFGNFTLAPMNIPLWNVRATSNVGFILYPGEQIVYRGPAAFVDVDRNKSQTESQAKGVFPGTLAVTNTRVLFSGIKGTLDRPIQSLTSVTPLPDGLVLQFGLETYPFQTMDATAFSQAIARVLNR